MCKHVRLVALDMKQLMILMGTICCPFGVLASEFVVQFYYETIFTIRKKVGSDGCCRMGKYTEHWITVGNITSHQREFI